MKDIHILKRSIHVARWHSFCPHQSTHVTVPQRLTIIKRFMFKKTIDKGKECVGDNCKETLQAMTTVNPNQTATPPVDNVAGNLQKNPDAQNTPLPLTEITQPMTPATSVPSILQTTSQDDLKRMVRDSYDNNSPTFQEPFKQKNYPVTENMPANREVVVGEVNRILTDKTKPNTQEQDQTSSTFSGSRGSISQNNSGPLGTQNPNHRTTLNAENTQTVPHTSTRGYASVHGGKYKFPPDPIIASNDSLPKAEGDQSGYHKVVVVSVCNKPECATTNCATETNLNTGDTQPNPCGEPKEYHQRLPEDHEYIVHELGGTLTHTVPPNMTGVRLDDSVDMKGDSTHQDLAVEKGTRPIDPDKFKQNEDLTLYLQTDSHTNVILNNMPPDSVLNEK